MRLEQCPDSELELNTESCCCFYLSTGQESDFTGWKLRKNRNFRTVFAVLLSYSCPEKSDVPVLYAGIEKKFFLVRILGGIYSVIAKNDSCT